MSEMKQRRTQGGPGGGHGPMGGSGGESEGLQRRIQKIGRVSVAVQMADGSCLHFGDFVLSIRDCRTKNHGFGHR